MEVLPNLGSKKIVCVVANYDFAENASKLKQHLMNFMPTYLIDGSSPETPTDSDFIIPNENYPGLLKKAIEIAEGDGYDWLFFIASDVEIVDFTQLRQVLAEVLEDSVVGVYSPTVTKQSRCAYPKLFTQSLDNVREVGIVEGFIFLTQVKLLRSLERPLNSSKFGWCLDVLLCHSAYASGKIVVADDRLIVYHPKSQNPVSEQHAGDDARRFIPKQIFDWADYNQSLPALNYVINSKRPGKLLISLRSKYKLKIKIILFKASQKSHSLLQKIHF